jgi:nitroreductase
MSLTRASYARPSVSALRPIRRVSQIRQFTDDPVPDDVLDQLLELARWTGSSKNGQPWHFIVVRDRETLRKIASLRPNIGWAAAAPVAIAIVLNGGGDPLSEAYDEGRVTERLLTGATMLGYGGGVAWFGEEPHRAEAKRLLGIPEGRAARQLVAIGRPKSREDPRPTGPPRGRKPLSEVVSFERFGTNKR